MHLKEVHLQTHLLEELTAFYRDTLGLSCAIERDGSLRVQTGTTDLFFHAVKRGTEPFTTTPSTYRTTSLLRPTSG